MLYSEFIEGTGCKENDYNYQIYKRLELMYMADDSISKQEIYEYGKKLVDNSKSEAEIAFENEINSEIARLKEDIAYYKQQVEFYSEVSWGKSNIKYAKDEIKKLRRRIKENKWILGQGEL